MITFVPELQRAWALEELRLARCDQALIHVSAGIIHETPAVVGRQSSDIMSYPQVLSIQSEAEFSFTHCLMVRVWDEFAVSTIETNAEDIFEGDTFRRFTKSSLLAAHAHIPGPIYHYELICDSIIDIVCSKPPTVVLRGGTPLNQGAL